MLIVRKEAIKTIPRSLGRWESCFAFVPRPLSIRKAISKKVLRPEDREALPCFQAPFSDDSLPRSLPQITLLITHTTAFLPFNIRSLPERARSPIDLCCSVVVALSGPREMPKVIPFKL